MFNENNRKRAERKERYDRKLGAAEKKKKAK